MSELYRHLPYPPRTSSSHDIIGISRPGFVGKEFYVCVVGFYFLPFLYQFSSIDENFVNKTFYIGIRRYPAPETTSGTHLHQRQEEKYKINRQIEKVKNFFPLLCQKREVSNPVGGRGVLVG